MNGALAEGPPNSIGDATLGPERPPGAMMNGGGAGGRVWAALKWVARCRLARLAADVDDDDGDNLSGWSSSLFAACQAARGPVRPPFVTQTGAGSKLFICHRADSGRPVDKRRNKLSMWLFSRFISGPSGQLPAGRFASRFRRQAALSAARCRPSPREGRSIATGSYWPRP